MYPIILRGQAKAEVVWLARPSHKVWPARLKAEAVSKTGQFK